MICSFFIPKISFDLRLDTDGTDYADFNSRILFYLSFLIRAICAIRVWLM